MSKTRLGFLPISRRISTQQVRHFYIGTGDEATRNTLKLMAEVIRESSHDNYVRHWAEAIVKDVPKDPIARITRIFDFLRHTTKYIHDPTTIEYIRTPIASLQLLEAKGRPLVDCDDITVLSLALLNSLGFNVCIRATSYKTKQFEHVYGLVKVRDQWFPLDCTMPEGFGWEAPNATRKFDMEIR